VPEREASGQRKIRQDPLRPPVQAEEAEKEKPEEQEGEPMRGRVTAALLLIALGALVGASPAGAAFGIKDFDVTYTHQSGEPVTQAGSHPYAMTTSVKFSTKIDPQTGDEVQDGAPRDLTFELPAGLVGARDAVETCSDADFLQVDLTHPASDCPDESVVGYLNVLSPGQTGSGGDLSPAFNLVPPPGAAAKIGFVVLHVPVAVLIRANPKKPHNLIASVRNTANVEPVGGTELVIWGNPADPSHDEDRGECLFETGTLCPVSIPERAFITLPRACTGPLSWRVEASSWEEPTRVAVAESASTLTTGGCKQLGFGPTIDSRPTSAAADSPSGLDFHLDVEDGGLTDPDGEANSDIRKAVVALPPGVTTNPAIAAGLGACTLGQYESESLSLGSGCPESSKVGSVEVETPLLKDEILGGSIFVAKQGDNPFGSLLSIYMVIKDPEVGVLVGAAGRVDPDPVTGQLTTTFDDLPQLPFSHFRFHFRGGDRAPLITPPTCGAYATRAELYPYADPEAAPLLRTAEFVIDGGANGAPCASGPGDLPNRPSFQAGTRGSAAGTYSPLVFRLERQDGSQRFRSVSATLAKGLVGKLAGIPFCSDAQIAAAAVRSALGGGAAELAAPSCPAASRVGSVTVGAGAGPKPYYVGGTAYLAGPYKGAPLSLEIITPAIAGPFDLGVVAVRTALHVDRETTQINAVSDPIPTILHGLPLAVRSIVVDADRPGFTLNPTSCEPSTITGTATSTEGGIASLSAYFQASNCAALGFKPALRLKLKGGTARGRNPQLDATLTYPKGAYANIARAQVSLPHSAFLDQSHIKTICTRVHFAADQCPKGAVYGKAIAVTPLLDEPLKGPVYLRSSDNPLPDLVADLRGQIGVALVGRIDSVRGGIRTTFESVPDAPVSKFTLRMRGGKKGLLVNSRDICRSKAFAAVRFKAHSGRVMDGRTLLANGCTGKSKRGPRRKG
jgi:hypothetical protein